MLIYRHNKLVEKLGYAVEDHRRRPRSRIISKKSLTGRVKPITLDFTGLLKQGCLDLEEQEQNNTDYKKPKYRK